jgi:hypothetical protein
MVVWKYFYVDIDPNARQIGNIKNEKAHNQISTIVYNHHMESQFHVFALWHTTNLE